MVYHRVLNITLCYTVKVAQSCPTLCDPMDCTIHGILQAKILEWVAFPFSRGSSHPKDQTQVSHIDRKSTRLNSSHIATSRMPSSA